MSTRPWFVDAFTSDYLDVYAHRDEASAAAEARAALAALRFDRATGPLLDLAAGAGRHALALARERCRVVCVDLSADLTSASRARGLRTVRADMRRLPFAPGAFAGVTMFFSSFGYFADDADHAHVLAEVARVLRPRAALFLDLMDPDTVRYHLQPQSVDIVDEKTVEVERRITPDGTRVEKSVRLLRTGDEPRVWVESVRLFTGEEVERLAARAGMVVETTLGDYDGRPYVRGETRRLVVLRRRT